MLNLFGPLTIARSRRPIVHASGGHLRVGQYAARSFPERWPAVPLLACHQIAAQGHRRALGGSLVAAPYLWARGLPLTRR